MNEIQDVKDLPVVCWDHFPSLFVDDTDRIDSHEHELLQNVKVAQVYKWHQLNKPILKLKKTDFTCFSIQLLFKMEILPQNSIYVSVKS